ncbi:branched-chain amino acid ABC transporter permease [Nocardioides pacificus]
MAVLAALVLPIYQGGTILQTGLFVMATAVAAIGLNILTGTAGQLSLGHGFFVAVGAYAYAMTAGDPGLAGGGYTALGWPPLLSAVFAVLCAGAVGVAFSPVAGRVRGIYLAVASLGLVFVGIHVLTTMSAQTGGFAGLAVPEFELAGLRFADEQAAQLTLAGVPFGRLELLWYLFVIVLVCSAVLAHRWISGREGRALVMVRDSEIGASVMGVNVQRAKAKAFTVSSMYAGLGGVMIALAYGFIVPENFGLALSIQFVAMIIIGGMGSVRGAIIGAVFVTGLTQALPVLTSSMTFLAQPGSDGVTAGMLARLVYGALVVACAMYLTRGLVSLPDLIRRSQR